MNELNDIRMRRYRNDLITGGAGYIFFGIWSVLKAAIQLIYFSDDIYAELLAYDDTIPLYAYKIALIVILAIASLIILLFHAYIGRSAIKFARESSRKKTFIVIAAILLLTSVYELIYIIWSRFADPNALGSDTSLAAILMQAATVYVLFDIMLKSVLLNKLRAEKAVT